ncbi:hypothetical protein BC830DRAFT_1141648 [Chytriomyces sp. MP71]|nr:hypothetical protein BC830DRAFT_1141648 [Chytriomyces sp. MP71]
MITQRLHLLLTFLAFIIPTVTAWRDIERVGGANVPVGFYEGQATPTISNATLQQAFAILQLTPSCALPCITNSTSNSNFTLANVISLCSQMSNLGNLIACGTKNCNATQLAQISSLFANNTQKIVSICNQVVPATTMPPSTVMLAPSPSRTTSGNESNFFKPLLATIAFFVLASILL